MGLNELNNFDFLTQKEFIRRMEDVDSVDFTQQIFLNLSDDAFDNMEVVFGPRMSDAEKILANALIEKYAPNCQCRESNLKIRK